jgi:hypothetical protein
MSDEWVRCYTDDNESGRLNSTQIRGSNESEEKPWLAPNEANRGLAWQAFSSAFLSQTRDPLVRREA